MGSEEIDHGSARNSTEGEGEGATRASDEELDAVFWQGCQGGALLDIEGIRAVRARVEAPLLAEIKQSDEALRRVNGDYERTRAELAASQARVAELLDLAPGLDGVSLIADAIREAANLGEATARAAWKPVMAPAGVASDTEEWYLQQLAPELPAELVKVARRPVAVTSSHSGVQSFTDWVSRRSGEAGPTPEVFVGKEAVQAKWNMENHGPKDSAALPLVACESWKALQQLIAGVGQKELHKLLTTSLHGHVDEKLAWQVSMLSHYVQSNCDVAISRTGLADVAISERLSLRFTGGGEDQTEEIGVEWTYTGPVWTCYDAPISVPLRMVISKEKDAGLRFEFAPLGLEALMLAYRRGLADDVALGLGVAGIPVYVGMVN